MAIRDKRGRPICFCGGYWFPHRKSGGACFHSPTTAIHHAIRAGDEEALLDALVAYAFDHAEALPVGSPCPF